jgi:hypothetical protein
MELAEVLYSRRKLLIFTTPTEGQYKVMKTHLDIQHVGNLDGVRKRMTFDPDSVAHLMSVLTDLYSDTEKAVIREYSTNALDSHRRIGVNKPVQVTSPTELHRFFTVTDFGEGMDKDQLTDEFGSYGYSSNRDTDATTGMLGLGCKSGLSYTFQFTVTSRKDGVETLALVTREEDGAGAIEIIDTQVTSDPNGTTVEVPVKDVRSFTHKMDEFYQYWDTGDVLVDGVEPPCVWDAPIPEDIDWMVQAIQEKGITFRLDDDIVIRQDIPMGLTMVMGAVPYPVDVDTLGQDDAAHLSYTLRNWRCGMAVRVPIGCLDFVPNREQLNYTKRSKDAVATAVRFVQDRMQAALQAAVDAQPDRLSAFKVASEMNNRRIRFAKPINKYRHEVIPTEVQFQHVHEPVLGSSGQPVVEYVTDGLELVRWSAKANRFGPPTPTPKMTYWGMLQFNPDWWSSDLKRWATGQCSGTNRRSENYSLQSVSALSTGVGLVITNCRVATLTNADKRKVLHYVMSNGLVASEVKYHHLVPVLNDSCEGRGGRIWDFVLCLPHDRLPRKDWWLRPGVDVVTLDEIRGITLPVEQKVTAAGTPVIKPKAGRLRVIGNLVDSTLAVYTEIPDDGSARLTAYVDTTKFPYNSNKRSNLESAMNGVFRVRKLLIQSDVTQELTRLSFVFVNAREKERLLKYYPALPAIEDWAKAERLAWEKRRPELDKLDEAQYFTPDAAEFSIQLENLIRAMRAEKNPMDFLDPDIRTTQHIWNGSTNVWQDLPCGWDSQTAMNWIGCLNRILAALEVEREITRPSKFEDFPKAVQEAMLLALRIVRRYSFFSSNHGWQDLHATRRYNEDPKTVRAQALEVLNSLYICREGLHLCPVL